MTGKLKEIVASSNHRMLRYIARVRWQDGLPIEEVRRGLGGGEERVRRR